MAACDSSSAQRLLARVLSGVQFKTIRDGVYETHHAGFLEEAKAEAGAGWWRELPAVCNRMVARGAEAEGADEEEEVAEEEDEEEEKAQDE